MAQKPETKFRKKVVEELKKLKHVHIFSIQQSSLVGTPDLLVCLNGRFVALEIKSYKTNAVGAQKYNLDKVAEAGGLGYTVHPNNWESVLDELNKVSCA